eukprot:1839691-Amphidinium_carterae.1
MASLVFVRKAMKYLFTENELEELDAREDKPMDDDLAPSKQSSKQHVAAAAAVTGESAEQPAVNATDA